MHAHAQFASHVLGSLTVGDEGLTWNNTFYAFRPIPKNGFGRKDMAALLGLHPRSLKRIELRSSALAAGRISINRRVLFYAVDAALEFIEHARRPVDLCAAITLGLPLTAVRPNRYGLRCGAPSRHSGGIAPLPVNTAQATIDAWETWRATHYGPDFGGATPQLRIPVLQPHIVQALTAYTDARLSAAKLNDWSRVSGHSPKHIEYQVAGVARILRDRLNTTEGQLLLALLFRSDCDGDRGPLAVETTRTDNPTVQNGHNRQSPSRVLMTATAAGR